MAEATVTINLAAVNLYLRKPGGDVGRMLVRKGQTWKGAAKATAPKGHGDHKGPRLADSIRTTQPRPGSDGRLEVIGFSAAPHARYVVRATRAHTIRPRTAKFLRFKIGGKTIFVRKVHHPGTKANDFMVRALHALR